MSDTDILLQSKPNNSIITSAKTILSNGVKTRRDKKGTPWSNAHRECLTFNDLMSDIDVVQYVGTETTQDEMFSEYVVFDINTVFPIPGKPILREYMVVAFIDLKHSILVAQQSIHSISTELQLAICRDLAKLRPAELAPKFFYACGDVAPFTMIELNINTGEEVQRSDITEAMMISKGWTKLWEKLGITTIRKGLEKFLFERAKQHPFSK